jgi:hypothetical protein
MKLEIYTELWLALARFMNTSLSLLSGGSSWRERARKAREEEERGGSGPEVRDDGSRRQAEMKAERETPC